MRVGASGAVGTGVLRRPIRRSAAVHPMSLLRRVMMEPKEESNNSFPGLLRKDLFIRSLASDRNMAKMIRSVLNLRIPETEYA